AQVTDGGRRAITADVNDRQRFRAGVGPHMSDAMAVRTQEHTFGSLSDKAFIAELRDIPADREFLRRGVEMMEFKRVRMAAIPAVLALSAADSDQFCLHGLPSSLLIPIGLGIASLTSIFDEFSGRDRARRH